MPILKEAIVNINPWWVPTIIAIWPNLLAAGDFALPPLPISFMQIAEEALLVIGYIAAGVICTSLTVKLILIGVKGIDDAFGNAAPQTNSIPLPKMISPIRVERGKTCCEYCGKPIKQPSAWPDAVSGNPVHPRCYLERYHSQRIQD